MAVVDKLVVIELSRMKKPLIIILFAIISFFTFAQNDNAIIIGHIDSLYSEILGEERALWIHAPEGTLDSSFTGELPVLYLLDGDAHFHSVTGLIKQLSSVNGNQKIPRMITVGIPNSPANRTRDLSPSMVKDRPESGGGNRFLDFIEKELMPYIESNYPVANHKLFVGHSLGGLTVINTLLHRPHLFTNYIAIDPSLWWNEQEMLGKADSVFQETQLDNKSLYVSIANTMQEGMEYSTIMSDTNEASKHIRSIIEFSTKLEENPINGLDFKWNYYENDSHGSVPLISEYDALRHMYSWYECECYNELFGDGTTRTGQEWSEILIDHYTMLSEKMGYDAKPEEQMFNGMAYWLLGEKEYEKAYAFFYMNIHFYPESYNVYDSMGDYYLAREDKESAAKYFEKCLELGGLPYTKEKLKKIKRDK